MRSVSQLESAVYNFREVSRYATNDNIILRVVFQENNILCRRLQPTVREYHPNLLDFSPYKWG